jgi:hypothetical protein
MNTTDKVRDLTSRKAIVIGANGGIGSCVARALASRGIAAALVGRNKDALTTVAQTCNEAGAESFPLHCDIAQIDSIESTVKTATLQTVPATESDGNSQAAQESGFSLHAGVVAQHWERKKLERLCRYITRPAISEKRLSITPAGNVRYQLKTPYRESLPHERSE